MSKLREVSFESLPAWRRLEIVKHCNMRAEAPTRYTDLKGFTNVDGEVCVVTGIYNLKPAEEPESGEPDATGVPHDAALEGS